MFEQWLPNGSHRLGCLLRMLGVTGAAPDDRADVFVVKMLWKHRSRWNDEKGKKAVDVFRSILNKFPIGAEYLRRLLHVLPRTSPHTPGCLRLQSARRPAPCPLKADCRLSGRTCELDSRSRRL